MKVVVSGGGTAGHINPALAVAAELAEQGAEVLYAGNPSGIEARLAPQAGLPFTPFEAAGFNRRHPLTLLTSSAKIFGSAKRAKRWLLAEKVDVVVGFGGYVELPVGYAASWAHIPLVIHEQNSVPGVANKALAKKASAVALTYGQTEPLFSTKAGVPVEVTGNPVRKSVLTATRAEGRAYLGVPEDATLLLVFGGSLGARHINTELAALKNRLLSIPGLQVVHITGPKEFDSVCEQLALTDEEGTRWRTISYCDHMGEVLAACDLVVSRAGATSLAEITALGVPALLVPYPFATGDHQTKNAASLVEAGAAVMVPDDKVETDLAAPLLQLLRDPQRRTSMHNAALSLRGGDAAARVAQLALAAAEQGRARKAGAR
ncbi:MAG: undecaprenyldiphospho-muramoylpentapeptide beta-N-acetylglucosaminyltransferase [Coriobacteriales bacterium]|nr:undecaprenyldiphospho-muramoylpentapeptide beta-N-acetylglucosaminyltransferase [Coriobacteriales bacterium]